MWRKDDTIDPPRVIFTREVGGVARMVYDPEAPAEQRLTLELRYLHVPEGETLQDIEASLGL